jgi:hypothetical protein
MFKRFYKSLEAQAGVRRSWLWFGILAVYFALLIFVRLPDRLARRWGYTGKQPMFALDMAINYSSAEAHTILDAYGDKGRQAYLKILVLFDFLYPWVYTNFGVVSLTTVFQRLGVGAGWRKLSLLPILTGLVDWIENLGIITMLVRYPRQLAWLSRLISILTMLKFLTAIIDLSLLIGSLLVLGWQRLFAKPKA